MSRNGVQQGGREAAPARRTLSRDSWIRLARKTLEARGVANVKVDRLARKLNVTRGSFYFHFKWLKDLLSALQEEWRTRNCAPFQALAAQTALPGIDLFEEIVATWVREEPFSPALDMAIRDWGRASRQVRKEVQAIDALRIGLLERSFRMMGYEADECLIRARITYLHQIGYYALALEITVQEDFAPTFVLNLMSTITASIVDEKLAMENEPNGDLGHEWLKTHSAGSGSFSLRSWKPSESYILDAFPDARRGPPTIERVIVQHIPEPTAQRLVLKQGDIDIARNVTGDQIEAIAGNPEIVVEAAPKATIYYLGLNQNVEILANPKMQEALRYLVDYQGMADSFLRGRFQVHQLCLNPTSRVERSETPTWRPVRSRSLPVRGPLRPAGGPFEPVRSPFRPICGGRYGS